MKIASLAVILAAALGEPATAQIAMQPAEQRLPACLGCHGATGASRLDGVPSLGAMPSDYVLIQLYLFREKQRVVPVMNAMAEGLTDDGLRTLADAIAQLPPPPPHGEALPAAELEQGQALVQRYRCNSCHGANLAGHDQIPRLAGQREEYLLKSLTDYKSNARPGYDPAMNEASQEIKLADIPVLARYLARIR